MRKCRRGATPLVSAKYTDVKKLIELEDGSLIEIKGYYTDLVAIKLKAVTDTKIKILYKNDLFKIFDYVKNNYTYKKLEDLYDK